MIKDLESQMKSAAKLLEFEKAAAFRDKMVSPPHDRRLARYLLPEQVAPPPAMSKWARSSSVRSRVKIPHR